MNEDNSLAILKQCFEKMLSITDSRTKINALEFLVCLVFCYVGDAKTFSLEAIRRSMKSHLSTALSRSAFWERLSGTPLKNHLRQIVAELMRKLVVCVTPMDLKSLGVSAIELVDSSSITLWARAQKRYPGTGGVAGIKWHTSVDLLTGMITWFRFTPASTHDRKGFPPVSQFLGKLVVFDLGYWDFGLLQTIDSAGGFFLSRLRSDAVVQVVEIVQGLGKRWLGYALLDIDLSHKRRGDLIEVVVEKTYRGKTSRWRAVGFWNPTEQGYHWYLTNLRVAAYLLYPLYRLRWQIELIFKACKNSLNANQIPSGNQNIIESLLLASLVAHLSSHTILAIGKKQLTKEQQLATSFQRVAQVAVILANDFIGSLLNTAQTYFDHLLQKIKLFATDLYDPNYRKRETSLMRVDRLLREAESATLSA